MSKEIFFVKKLGILRPAYDSDQEAIKKLPAENIIKGVFTVPRNPGFHKKFFAMLNMAFQNQEKYTNINDLREDLIIEAGFYIERIDLHGEVKRKAKSMSWASMDELEFEELFDKIADVICKYILKGVTNEEIRDNLLAFM